MSAFTPVTRARAAMAAALFVFVACAGVAVAQEPLKIFGLTIPDRIGGLPHGQVRDYEKTNPGLGYSIPFQKSGWLIDVYLYDMRLNTIPDDPGSDVVTRQLAQAKGDVFELGRRGYYDNVEAKGDYTIDRNSRLRFVCAAFTYEHKQMGATVDSYLCVTSWQNKFFKIRMTARQNENSRAEAAKFFDAWIDILWPS